MQSREMASDAGIPRARSLLPSKTNASKAEVAHAPARSIFARVPAGLWPVLAVVLFLAVWRVAFVLAGPDPDSDAYGHHAIARQILVDPKNRSEERRVGKEG